MAERSRWLTPDFGCSPDSDPKVQAIRTIDLFIMGPVMIWFAVTHPKVPVAVRLFMFASGVGTSLFNGANLVRCLEEKERGDDGVR